MANLSSSVVGVFFFFTFIAFVEGGGGKVGEEEKARNKYLKDRATVSNRSH